MNHSWQASQILLAIQGPSADVNITELAHNDEGDVQEGDSATDDELAPEPEQFGLSNKDLQKFGPFTLRVQYVVTMSGVTTKLV